MEKFSYVQYFTRRFYEDIISNGGSVEDVIGYESSDNVSPLSKVINSNIQGLIEDVLLNPYLGKYRGVRDSLKSLLSINKDEEAYAKDNAETFLFRDPNSDQLSEVLGSSEKCYEIVVHPVQDVVHILVLVEGGFLNDVTETKEVLLEFFLTVLRHGYLQGASCREYLHEYLASKLSDSYFKLVETRLDRR